MRRALIVSAFLLTVLGATTASATHVVRYVSKHPIPRKVGHGFCYITVPHVHDYEPSDPRLYRQMDGQYYFVGDPAPFEYDGPRYSYYGAHPIADVDVHFGAPTYCYLRGPHYHWYAPPPQTQFELRGGAYWYVGNYDPVYYNERPRYVVINDAYAPVVYTRPVIDVRVAPPAFHGEIVAVGPGMAAHAVVGAPVVSAGVYVAAPPPPVVQVGIGVGVGGPVVGGPGPVYVDRHHDNGRHNGWYKNGRGVTAAPARLARRAAAADDGLARKPSPGRRLSRQPERSAARASTATPSAARPAPAPNAGFRGSPAPAHGQPAAIRRRAGSGDVGARSGHGGDRERDRGRRLRKERGRRARRRWSRRAGSARPRPRSTSTGRLTPMRRSGRGRAPA